MSSILNIAVSGLNEASARIANATSNIVNAQSTNYVPQDVITLSNSVGGNNLGVTTVTQPNGGDGVDLASNLVNIDVAKNNYGADAAVIKVAQKMEKALLDITT